MKRHPFNVFSLMFGTALILLASWAAWIALPWPGWLLRASDWLLPSAAILVGAAMLIPLLTRRSQTTPGVEDHGDSSGQATDPPPDHP